MGTRNLMWWLLALFLAMVPMAVRAAPADRLEQAQAAVIEAEKNVQRAIDRNPKVVAARDRVTKTQALVDGAINLNDTAMQMAIKKYQVAQREEADAVAAAAPNERGVLAARQRELLAIRGGTPPPPSDAAMTQPATPKKAESGVTPPIRIGDVEVRLLHVRIGPVSYNVGGTNTRLSDPLLGVLINVANLGKAPVSYIGWNTNAIATDAAEKQYLPAGVAGGTVLGRVVQSTLPAGRSLVDLVVLQRPPDGKELTITLPAYNVGGLGAFQFHLSVDKIEQGKEPLVDPKNPPVVPAPEPVAEAPVSQPAGVMGKAGHSADGVDYPPVTDGLAKHDHARPIKKLTDVCELLHYPPANLNLTVYSVEKSLDKLAPKMSHQVDVPGTRARGVTHVTRTESDPFDPACQWFGFNVANSDVAGFEIHGGVITRIVLYYRRTDAAQRALLASYGQAPKPNISPNGLAVECGPWVGKSAGGTTQVDPVLKQMLWPVNAHESPATIELDLASLTAFENGTPPRAVKSP
ncbi:MAG TPA: hypothetical protein VIM11_01460 [Tepidisphaeraceae bacterium]